MTRQQKEIFKLKFKRYSKALTTLEQINLTPLIDVILLLLIFFLLSASLTSQSGINVKLPKAITSDAIKEENLTITITSENVIYLNNKIITIRELRRELGKNINKSRPVLIKADRRSSMGRIVDVWDLCRELGIEKINIATDQEK